jgi:hypothetical protein
MAMLAASGQVPAPPRSVELRDGQIVELRDGPLYRWNA